MRVAEGCLQAWSPFRIIEKKDTIKFRNISHPLPLFTISQA
jgi:hypothetical protein